MADLPCIFLLYSSSILKGSLYGSFWYMLYVGWMYDFLPTPLRLGPASMFLGLVFGLPSSPLMAASMAYYLVLVGSRSYRQLRWMEAG